MHRLTQAYAALPYTVLAAAYKMDLSKTTMVYVAGEYENFPSVSATTATGVTGAGPSSATPVSQSAYSGTNLTTIAVGIQQKF